MITYPGQKENIQIGDLVILGSFSNSKPGIVIKIVNEKSVEAEALIKIDRNFCWRLVSSIRKLEEFS